MSFKSLAQRRKFKEMVKAGKMSEADFAEWDKATDLSRLPERVSKKPKSTKFKPVRIVK